MNGNLKENHHRHLRDRHLRDRHLRDPGINIVKVALGISVGAMASVEPTRSMEFRMGFVTVCVSKGSFGAYLDVVEING